MARRKDEFKLSKRIKDKLKDQEKLKEELANGKTIQEIIEFSDETMAEFYKAAHHLFDNRRFLDAANAFLFLVTLNPHVHEYWLGLGMSAQMCKEYEAAVDAYEMAAICEIESPVPYFYLAKCLFAMHERESTLQALDLAIEYAENNDQFEELKREAIKAREILLKSGEG